MSDDDLAFIESLPYTITIPELNSIVVHAGLVPGVSLVEQEPDYMVRMRNIVDEQPTHLIDNGTRWADVYDASNKVGLSLFLERILKKYLDNKVSSDSKLQINSICFIRIRSRK